ncbi:MAG: hypothetical protein CYPHOPRED_000591 [Cyphobasidiales sp. Tagirdzhanova-0007]|nr:MAG: hypothetical protein CYPHOPRED_000591 [Cyphobasidiales sp. Tagirdzhanova-0007]
MVQDHQNQNQTTARFGRRSTLFVLVVLDIIIVGLMAYSTTVPFEDSVGDTVTLDQKGHNPLSGLVNKWRLRFEYAIYAGTSIYGSAALIYYLVANFSQYPRRKQWEQENAELDHNLYAPPRSRCIDFTGYFYTFAWILGFIAASIGLIVCSLSKENVKFAGMFGVKAERGAWVLFVAWGLLLVVGLWRVIYKVGSHHG